MNDQAAMYAGNGKENGLSAAECYAKTTGFLSGQESGAADIRKAIEHYYPDSKPLMTAIQQVPRWTIPDLDNYEPDPKHYIAGNGFLRRGAACLLTGGTGIGKSVLAAQIGMSVASGMPILGRITTKQGRVLYIQAENDKDTCKRDFLSLRDYLAPDCEPDITIHHAFGLGDVFHGWLEATVAIESPDLIIIDPYQAYVGGVDINNSQSFLTWSAPINSILNRYHCALLLVAHTPKPRDRDNWNSRETVYMAAGTSAISNWARTSCELVTVGQETKRFKLTFGKNAERTGLYDEVTGRTVRELYVQHSESSDHPYWTIADDQTKPSSGKYDEAIRQHLQGDPEASVSATADVVGCDKSTVSRTRKRLGI